jgi:hypothetical protein
MFTIIYDSSIYLFLRIMPNTCCIKIGESSNTNEKQKWEIGQTTTQPQQRRCKRPGRRPGDIATFLAGHPRITTLLYSTRKPHPRSSQSRTREEDLTMKTHWHCVRAKVSGDQDYKRVHHFRSNLRHLFSGNDPPGCESLTWRWWMPLKAVSI